MYRSSTGRVFLGPGRREMSRTFTTSTPNAATLSLYDYGSP